MFVPVGLGFESPSSLLVLFACIIYVPSFSYYYCIILLLFFILFFINFIIITILYCIILLYYFVLLYYIILYYIILLFCIFIFFPDIFYFLHYFELRGSWKQPSYLFGRSKACVQLTLPRPHGVGFLLGRCCCCCCCNLFSHKQAGFLNQICTSISHSLFIIFSWNFHRMKFI